MTETVTNADLANSGSSEVVAGEKVLEIEGLQTYFYTRDGIVKAVDDE